MAARKKKRGPSLDDKYLGPEPIYTEESEFNDLVWTKGAHWYNYFYKQKDYMPTTYQFAMDYCGYDKKKVSVLKRLKDSKFMKVNKTIKLYTRGYQYEDGILERAKAHIDAMYKEGLLLKKIEEKQKAKVVVISPAERAKTKVLDTIYHDWDSIIVEGWFDNNFTQTFSCYNRFKGHGLKGNAINTFKALIEPEYENIKAAYEKTDEDCIEGYSHISKGDKRKIMKQFEDVFDDLEKLRSSFKATKIPRAKKVKASDQQVSKLKYCEEDDDVKLTSINPVLIPTKHKLFVYNRKNKKLIEYVTDSIGGFEVSGTSIKNFNSSSKQATIRKPDEILPMVINKTEKQLEKLWDSLTTKVSIPSGRINADCILMRTF